MSRGPISPLNLAATLIATAISAVSLFDLAAQDKKTPPPMQAKQNYALSLGWGGYADTDLTFGDFFARDHTLVMHFMPQYVHSYAAPLFAENGTGNFIVGIGDYAWSKAELDKPVAPILFVQIGPKRQIYDLAPLERSGPLARDAIVLADFENGYAGWKIEGNCFGKRPAAGKIKDQNVVAGWRGKFFVNTYSPDDSSVGKATSAPFAISKRYLHFLIGGGRHPGKCCLNLVVDGKIVRSATGKNSEKLEPTRWDLQPWLGQTATLHIVDEEKGNWGHILVDQIVLTDTINPSLVFPGLMKEAWHHFALVRSGTTYALYLDGHHLEPDVAIPKTDLPDATTLLRLGRRTGDRIVAGSGEGQFYGLIGSAGVFGRALGSDEVRELSERIRLSGTEKGLLADWNFSPQLKKKGTARGVTPSEFGSIVHSASAGGNPALDRKLLDPGDTSVRFQLPFPVGEAWSVIQGCDEAGGSHSGYASFCWDFMLAGKPQAKSRRAPLYAATDGQVVWVTQSHPLGYSKELNRVMVKAAEGMYVGYLHIAPGSYSQAQGKMLAKPPQELVDKPLIKAGQMIAHCGDVGAAAGAYHLHLGVTNFSDDDKQKQRFVTFPVAFLNYEASDDEGKTWHHVERGMPTNGQWVKRLR